MARLPGINYNTPVQSLGREGTGGPLRVAAAESAALSKIGQLGIQYENIRRGAEHDNALVAFTRATEETNQLVAEYKARPPSDENAAELEDAVGLVRDKHRHDLGTHGNRAFDKSWRGFSSQKRTEFGVHHVYAKNNAQRAETKFHVENLAKGGDLPTAIEIIGEAAMFTETEKAEMRFDAQTSHGTHLVEKTGRGGTPEEMKELIAQIQDEDGGFSDIFTQSQRNGAVNFLETKHDSLMADELAATLHEQERYASNLEIAIKGDEMGGDPVAIEQAFDAGLITGAKRTELNLAWQKQQVEGQEAAQRAALISHSIENQIPLDPKNKIHKAAVEEAYVDRMGAANSPELTPQEQRAAKHAAFEYGMNLSIKTNIMPDAMAADFRTHAIAGTDDAVQYLSNSYERLEVEAPQTLHNIGTEQRAIYGSVAALNRAGMPLGDAVVISRENAMATQETKDVLAVRYKAEDKTSSERLEKQIGSATGFWSRTPEATAAMEGSYSALENAFYQLTGGDAELASSLAFKELSRVYSRTDVNGKAQSMPYAPEREMNMTEDALRGQLKTVARKNNVPIDNLIVVPDSQTARDRGVKSYALYQTNEFGLPEPVVDDNNIPVRWEPDAAASRQAKVAESRVQQVENAESKMRATALKAKIREERVAKEVKLGLDKLQQPMREKEGGEFNIPEM